MGEPVVPHDPQDAGRAGAILRSPRQQGYSILAFFQPGEYQGGDDRIGPTIEVEDFACLRLGNDLHGVDDF